jgi:hypothetical protein
VPWAESHEPGERGNRIDFELVHHPATVRFDSVLACAELDSDLTGDKASRQQLADFTLTPGESRESQLSIAN